MTSTDAIFPRTKIINGIIVAFDGQEHCLLQDGVLVFAGDTIIHVGKSYEGAYEHVIDAQGKLVIPGQISTHSHISAQEGSRAILDGGRNEFSRSFFLNYLPTPLNSGKTYLNDSDHAASIRYGIASLIRHGVTTAVNFAPGTTTEGNVIVDLANQMGLRLYYAPVATSGSYHIDSTGRLKLLWDEAAGLRALDEALEFIDNLTPDHRQLVTPIITVDEAFVATPSLLQRARDAATCLGFRLTLHAAEQIYEFHDAIRQRGKTPVGVLAEDGILGPDLILAHCVYTSGHSATGYPFGQDLEVLARTGTTVAHSPTVMARRGNALESFQRYVDAGVNVALGTDSYPLDMIGEMRAAAQIGKVVDQRYDVALSRDIFNASNLAGARALGRPDLGRLSPGAKADIVLVDFDNLAIGSIYDPIRSLVHCANGSMVDTVIINGRTVLAEKQLLVCDEREVLQDIRATAAVHWATASERHWASQTIEEQFPRSLKFWEEPVGQPQPVGVSV